LVVVAKFAALLGWSKREGKEKYNQQGMLYLLAF
jgi:hypothetical protein